MTKREAPSFRAVSQATAPDKDEVKVKIFVYGTLKKGHKLHQWMAGSTYILDMELPDAALVPLWGYPGLITGMSPKHSVIGEVWAMPISKFMELKTMEEGAGYHTKMVQVRTLTSPTETMNANTFVYHNMEHGEYEWVSDGQTAQLSVVGD